MYRGGGRVGKGRGHRFRTKSLIVNFTIFLRRLPKAQSYTKWWKNAGPLFLQSKLFNYCDTKMRSLYWPSASCISPAVFALSPIVYHWSFVYLCIPIVYHWSFVAKMPTFGILMCICEDLIALCAILCCKQLTLSTTSHFFSIYFEYFMSTYFSVLLTLPSKIFLKFQYI